MRGRLTEEQRAQIAADAHDRYEAGESWQQIGHDLDLHSETVRRLVQDRRPVTYRRWGQRPVADPAEVARRRGAGETLDAIALSLGCSRTAVRTALESEQGPPVTRYPRLGARRSPTDVELAELQRLLDDCPSAPRARPGYFELGGREGFELATACLSLVEDGIPMATLSRALGHGPTWVHWLLGKRDLQPPERQSHNTSRRTRTFPREE